jgi:hypothetical protein
MGENSQSNYIKMFFKQMFLTVKYETIIKSPNKQIIRNTRLQYEQGIKGYLFDVGSVVVVW